MLRRIALLFTGLLLVALLSPLIEPLEKWDHDSSLGCDTEFHVVALSVAAGLWAAVALCAARGLRLRRCSLWMPAMADTRPVPGYLPDAAIMGNSPPLIALRI